MISILCRLRLQRVIHLGATVAILLGSGSSRPIKAADEVLPKHVTPEALKAVRAGLDYLARTQSDDGAWREGQGGQAYPVAMSSLACTAMLAPVLPFRYLACASIMGLYSSLTSYLS